MYSGRRYRQSLSCSTSTESVPGVAKCFGIFVPVISTLYLSTNPGGTFVPVISTLYLSTNPGWIRFYCTDSGGPHWKVPVHIGGSLYSGQSNVMTFSLSPVLNWRYNSKQGDRDFVNSKQGDRDFVSTIKLGYRENVSSSVWLTFRSPSLVTFRFPSLVNQSNVSKNNVNQSVSLLKKVHELFLSWSVAPWSGQFLAPQKRCRWKS